MKEHTIKLRDSQIRANDITHEYKDAELRDSDHIIRMYRSSPDGFTLQLRTYGPTTYPRKGKNRRVLATADYLGIDELDKMIDQLTQIRAEITDKL